MSDDLLLAAVKAVPMRCADCGETTATEAECPDGAVRGQRVRVHAFETDDAAIVRAVRAAAEGKAQLGFLQANQTALNQMARALKRTMSVPGVRVDFKRSTAQRFS